MNSFLVIKNWIIALLILFVFSVSVFGQTNRCLDHKVQYNDIELRKWNKGQLEFKKWKQKEIKSNSNSQFEIPVVVHVLYRTGAENISDAQINSQIDVLNEDYNKLNQNWTNTIAQFHNIVGNPSVSFKLATVDPNGVPTSGIIRKQTNKTGFDYTANEAKYTNLGGSNAWDPSNYLNIWVVNDITYQGIKNAVLGYAQFPELNAATDGLVIRYEVFGRTGNLIPGYDQGRTATHEIGHWLGLKHLWGMDAQDGCNAQDDDDISDTPLQGASSSGCPTNQYSCGSLDNVQNFMDYSDDACMTMFTLGQVEKIQYTLSNIRTNFKVVSDNKNDVKVNLIELESLCGNSISPTISLTNLGSTPISSLEFKIKAGNTTIFSGIKSIQITPGSTQSILISDIQTLAANNETINVEVLKVNGVLDEDASNNIATTSFSLEPGHEFSFKISAGSKNSNLDWTIENNQTIYKSHDQITPSINNGFYSQKFCLETKNCYTFEVTDAFISDLCAQYEEFNLSTQYQTGEQFVYNSTIYEAKQLIWGSNPETFAHYYNNLGPCPDANQTDYLELKNMESNEIIIQKELALFTSPSNEDFCLSIATSNKDNLNPNPILFPNPFISEINFKELVNQVKIYSINGTLIKEAQNVDKITLDKTLTNGLYFIEITIGGTVYNQKIIKRN